MPTTLEISRAAGRPPLAWNVDGDLEGGARTYRVSFTDRRIAFRSDPSAPGFYGGGNFYGGDFFYGAGPQSGYESYYVITEEVANGAKDGDRVRIVVEVLENAVQSVEEVIEGTIDAYEIEETSHIPVIHLQGRDALKAALVDFFPTAPVTYQGRIVAADGTLGQVFWTFQQAVADILKRASVTKYRFFVPDYSLGTDLVWSQEMSAAGAIEWLVENGGMRATERFRVDVFPVREPDGWYLYVAERGRYGTTVEIGYGERNLTRSVRVSRPESFRWPSVQVLGMRYQVQGPMQIFTRVFVPGHPWTSGYTHYPPAEDVRDEQRGLLLRRKSPHAIYHFQDGRIDREEWTDTIYTYSPTTNALTNTRIERGECTYGYDLATVRKISRTEIVRVVDDPSKPLLASAIILDRREKWEYGQIVTAEGTLTTIVRLHGVSEYAVDENNVSEGQRLVVDERTEIMRSGLQLLKRYTRRTLDRATGATVTQVGTTELVPGDLPDNAVLSSDETSLAPNLRLEERELKSGADGAFRVLRYPAIGDQAWLDQVLANVNAEKTAWRHEGSGWTIVPDLRVLEGVTLKWKDAPSRWKMTQLLVTSRSLRGDARGRVAQTVHLLTWE